LKSSCKNSQSVRAQHKESEQHHKEEEDIWNGRKGKETGKQRLSGKRNREFSEIKCTGKYFSKF
jgi:hypothetical protein